MRVITRLHVLGSLLSLLAVCSVSTLLRADESELSRELEAARERATADEYVLRYTFHEGETLRWKVRHLGTTEATVHGTTQSSKMRAISTKEWKVTSVDAEGNSTFVYTVTDVDMWQKISGRPEVSYNSSSDASPPSEYVQVAKSVGVPIATVKVSNSGKVLERDKAPIQANTGMGDIIMPLPMEKVKIGDSWHVSNEIRVRAGKTGRVERIKTRLVYTLEQVKTGVATVSVRTELVTPVNDPSLRSQLVQQMTNGQVRFDLDAGRILSQQIDWDETVVGFSGDDSLMKYLARFTEDLLPVDATASKPADDDVR